MNSNYVLLVAAPSPVRDGYEQMFRQHSLPVMACDGPQDARDPIQTAGIHAALVIQPLPGDETDAFLLALREQHPFVPLLLAGDWDPRRLISLVGEQMVMLLPPGVTPQSLEHFLFYRPPTANPASTREKSDIYPKRVHVERSDYSLEYRQAKAEFETVYLMRVIELCGGNITQAARTLGMARRNLQLKIKALKLPVSASVLEITESSSAE
jgi:hypothetical protein